MRTTVRLDPDLLHEIKRAAAEDHTTLTALLEQAVRELLARRRQAHPRPRLPLPTYAGRGLQPGVDLDDTAALLDLMDRRDAPD
ncbi:MAG TPA: ribbon-helix-helix protein, CopG family [Chloroflexota bacterium]|nr:ribbon-helix-helix protein, CopG family [Chloroflexota bacterium]